MAQKKKNSATRSAKYSKAGSNRKPYKAVMREKVLRKRNGQTFTVMEESHDHMRRGAGSNKRPSYTGSPLDCLA